MSNEITVDTGRQTHNSSTEGVIFSTEIQKIMYDNMHMNINLRKIKYYSQYKKSNMTVDYFFLLQPELLFSVEHGSGVLDFR